MEEKSKTLRDYLITNGIKATLLVLREMKKYKDSIWFEKSEKWEDHTTWSNTDWNCKITGEELIQISKMFKGNWNHMKQIVEVGF